MSQLNHQIQQSRIGSRAPATVVYTPTGEVYLHAEAELPAQPIARETRRTTQRRVWTADGRAGLEITDEHDVVYAPPLDQRRPRSDVKRTVLAGVVAFIATSLAFTMLGGGEQGPALIPFYWIAFGALWWWLL